MLEGLVGLICYFRGLVWFGLLIIKIFIQNKQTHKYCNLGITL